MRKLTMRTLIRVLALPVVVVAVAGCDPASLYGPLRGQWTKQPSAWPIAAKPAVGGGTAYIGSWDGNEYAFDEASGAVTWSSNLGVTHANCGGTIYAQGVTSSPALQGGTAYLGGGGTTWDALDTATGNVLWTVPTGDNSLTGGHYNWSSPAVYNGYAYVGIASFCDSPLVQGELLRVNLSTHQIENTFKVVPDGQIGGGIWTNPVIDPDTNTVFVATGSSDGSSPPYAESILALDATTLAIKSSWRLPPGDMIIDADFATTPVLFTDGGGRRLLAVTNKNGLLYALPSDDISAGPVWETRIADSADECDMCAGSFSNGLFDGTRLYYAAGKTTVGGQSAGGSIRAIDPTTGAVLWEHALPAQVFGALDGANGMVAVPSSDGGLYVVRASDGVVLYANALKGAAGAAAIFAAPTIADGYLFVGTTDGVVHAFKFPASTDRPPAVARSASVRGAPGCTARDGAVLTADCRVAIGARARCARLGELPAAVGAVVVDRITGRASASRANVRLYTNGSCAGGAALSLHVTARHALAMVGRHWKLAPGTVVSVRGSRRLALSLHLAGHRLRAASGRRQVLRFPASPG
jgi:outer membrane protein assembly factor BamB